MHVYITRSITDQIKKALKCSPVVAILGSRQCGKSTLAKKIISEITPSEYIDLEMPSQRSKLHDPETFFRLNRDKLICLDEIQRLPELFSVMRAIIDEVGRNGLFIVLGSASPSLLRQSSETLAGRITYFELTPFLLEEISGTWTKEGLHRLWLRGGYPRSYLAEDDATSLTWRQNFIATFLERDIPQLGIRIPARMLDRFWRMCAHVHGQLLNSSRLGESLGVSYHTVRSYMELLEQTFILRVLKPYATNLKKRLIKSPKLYIRDTGLLHALHDIGDQNHLLGHPVYGASWEGFAIENIIASLPEWQPYFYRTATGSEIDLVLVKGTFCVAIETKVSSAPDVSRKLRAAIDDLQPNQTWIAAPVGTAYPVDERITVAPIPYIIDHMRKSRFSV